MTTRPDLCYAVGLLTWASVPRPPRGSLPNKSKCLPERHAVLLPPTERHQFPSHDTKSGTTSVGRAHSSRVQLTLYTQQKNGLRVVRWRRTHESSKHGQTDSIVQDTRHEYSGCCSVHIIPSKFNVINVIRDCSIGPTVPAFQPIKTTIRLSRAVTAVVGINRKRHRHREVQTRFFVLYLQLYLLCRFPCFDFEDTVDALNKSPKTKPDCLECHLPRIPVRRNQQKINTVRGR